MEENSYGTLWLLHEAIPLEKQFEQKKEKLFNPLISQTKMLRP